MKPFTLLILAAVILSACQANNLAAAPIATSTLPATETKPAPTLTEAPTVVPETVEQRMYRIASEAVAHGAVANDPKTWVWGEAVEFQKIAFDPTHATREQLIRLYDWDTAIRQANFEKYIRDNYQEIQSKDILGKFGRDYVKDAEWVPTASAMTKEQALDVVADLTPQLRHDLELVRRNINGEYMRRSPWEQIQSAEIPNNLFTKNTGVNEAKEPYFWGFWAGEDIQASDVKNAMNKVFTLNVFGQPTKITGISLYGTTVADFVGKEKIYGTPIINPDGTITPNEKTAIIVLQRKVERGKHRNLG